MSKIQYTVRNIPPVVDQVIKKRAQQSGKSFNQTVVDLLALQTVGSTNPTANDDFNWLSGALTLDKTFDEGMKDLSRLDDKLWQ